MNSEIEKLQKLISDIPFPFTVIIDTNKTAKHWFLNYKYFVIREDYTFDNLPFKTCFNENESGFFKSYAENEVLKSIRNYWTTNFQIGRIEIIAWCSEIVEKDSTLFYLYDNQDIFKGLYCHSLNWTENVVFVGDGLATFYDLEKSLDELKSIEQVKNDFLLHRKELSMLHKMTFEDLLLKDEYLILDAEFGFEPSFEFYKNYIDTTIIPLTQHELRYSSLKLISDSNGKLKFNWKGDTKIFTFMLDNSSDYIDGKKFYKKINEILTENSASKLLVPFRHDNFGQEYGLAYLNSEKTEKLSQLFNIELI